MRYVAFLRAVNVGGRTVKMDLLKASCERAGLTNVVTFIASGNVIFDSRRAAPAIEHAIEAQLEADFGFRVGVMVRSLDQLRDVQTHVETRALNAEKGVTLYVGFLKATPDPAATKAASALSNEIDRLSVNGRELYWQGAKGLGQSTLTGARVEKLLGTAATLRNINTINRIVSKFGNS